MDDVTLRELQLFTENDADLYRQKTTPIVRRLRTRQAQGTYDHDRAVDMFMYLAEAGARKYAREHGGGEHEWNKIFPTDVRRAAATAWRDEFEQESADGNYDNATYLPKKYLHGKCIEPDCPNTAVGPHGLCTRHVAEFKKPAGTTQSRAHQLGSEDGVKYVHREKPSRTAFKKWPSSKRPRPHDRLLHWARTEAALAKELGIEPDAEGVISNRQFGTAFREYDEGFWQAGLAVLDAAE
jgi:hypothetical protein